MSLPRSAAEVVKEHVVLQIEGIDRMYLNVYASDLQRDLASLSQGEASATSCADFANAASSSDSPGPIATR